MLCKHCGQPIYSDENRFCTNCGAFIPFKKKNRTVIILSVIGGILFFFIIGSIINGLKAKNSVLAETGDVVGLLTSDIDPSLITDVDYFMLYDNWEQYASEYELKFVRIAGRVSFVGYDDVSQNTYLEFADGIKGKIRLNMQLPLSESTYKVDDKIIVVGWVSQWFNTDGGVLYIDDCHVESLGSKADAIINKYATARELAEQNRIKAEQDRIKAEEEAKAKAKLDYKAKCKTVDYKTIARDPDGLNGQFFKFTGEVIQAVESAYSSSVEYRINITKSEYGYYSDTIYVTYSLPEGSPRILEDDIVTLWGQSGGLYTYTSVLGSAITLPKINAVYIDIVK